ncbi:MAG TPA: hypothetical protein VGL56_14230 [Fimbriimonadaceae bacterium]|jgi:hypothetical protein
MVLAIAGVVVLAAELGMSDLRQEIRYEDQQLAQRTWDAATSMIDDLEANGSLTLPDSRSFTLNGVSGTLATVDNSSSLANSIKVTSTLTTPDGRTYPEWAILCKAVPNTPFDYALFVNSAFTSNNYTFNTGASSANGDIFANGNISITGLGSAGSNVVNGSIYSSGNITTSKLTVTGTTSKNNTAITFPSVTAANYQAIASVNSSNNTLTGGTFPTVYAGNPYPVWYYSNGGVSVSGTFGGIGTVFLNGSVSISGAMAYANTSSTAVFIVNGNLTVNGGAMVGYWFVTGNTSINSGGLDITQGALVTNTISFSANTTSVMDPTVKSSVTTGNLLHLPGYTWNTNDFLAGTWSGPYTVTSQSDTGTLAITVSNSGVVTGTTHDASEGNGTVTGTLTSAGVYNATYVYSGSTWTASGTMTQSGGVLTGAITATCSSIGTYTENVSLTY